MEERGSRKTRVGKVVSDSMNKTITVAVESTKRHPLYKKTIKRTTKFKAHDEANFRKSEVVSERLFKKEGNRG